MSQPAVGVNVNSKYAVKSIPAVFQLAALNLFDADAAVIPTPREIPLTEIFAPTVCPAVKGLDKLGFASVIGFVQMDCPHPKVAAIIKSKNKIIFIVNLLRS